MRATGAYAVEKLSVEVLPSPGVGLAERALLDGAVEVLWAGPMRAHKHHDENSTRPLPALQRSSAAIRSRSSANTPIRVSSPPTFPKCPLPSSARCPHHGCACRRICARQASTSAATQRWPRRSHQSSQRSIAPCWSPHSRATRYSRCRARAVFPEGGLIVCGDAWSRVGSSVGRRHSQPASTIASPGKA